MKLHKDYSGTWMISYELIKEIPKEVLCALNSRKGSELLQGKKYHDALEKLYQENPRIFKSKLRSWDLWNLRYVLESKYMQEDEGIPETMIYKEKIKNSGEFQRYKEYLETREQLKVFSTNLPIHPSDYIRGHCYRKADYLRKCLKEEAEIDRKLQIIAENEAEKYEYEDDKYIVRMPRTLKEFVVDAEALYHDHWEFLFFIAWSVEDNMERILLVREKENPEEPYIALELVMGNEIITMSEKYNQEVSGEMKVWLEDYADKKGMIFREKSWVEEFDIEDEADLPFD